jgi:hypothetical protein
MIDQIENGSGHLDLIGMSDDRFDAGASLGGVSGVGDDDPVAVAIKRQTVGEDLPPVRVGTGIGSIEGMRFGGRLSLRLTCRQRKEQNGRG